MLAPEETAVCRERRRVWRLEHQMFRLIDARSILLGWGAPEHEHQMITVRVNGCDYRLGKRFPALPLV